MQIFQHPKCIVKDRLMFSTDWTGYNNTVGLLGFDPLYGKGLICALYLCTYNNVCLTKVRTYAIFVNNILFYQRHFVGSVSVKVVSFNGWEHLWMEINSISPGSI